LATCQQGLQFFPDRLAGTRELRRVIRDGGRAVVAVWQGLDRHPLYAALAEAEAPHLAAHGVEVSHEELVQPFSLGDPDVLRDLLSEGGFRGVEVVECSIAARFPDADRFVERIENAYAAVVPAFMDDPDAFASYLAGINRETKEIVEEYRDGEHVVVPMHANIAVARV
jgi:SAM-dependent methyltransferase